MLKILSSSGYPDLELASIYCVPTFTPANKLLRLAELWANDSRGIADAATVSTPAFSYFKLDLPPCGQGKNYQDDKFEPNFLPFQARPAA